MAGMIRTAVVLLLMTPDGHLVGDDAGDGLDGGVAGNGDHIEADRADAGHGLKLLEREGTCLDGGDHARIFGNGMKAPERPPTLELAITPPFLTASFSMARAHVVPGRRRCPHR